MSNENLPTPPIQVPLAAPILARQWVLYFNSLTRMTNGSSSGIAALEQAVAALQAQVATISAELDVAEGDISALQAQYAALQVQVDDLVELIEFFQNFIGTLPDNLMAVVYGLKSKLDSLEKVVAYNQAEAATKDLVPNFYSGLVEVDFGIWLTDVSVTITGQTWVKSTSAVTAQLSGVATVDHSVDEHLVESIKVTPYDLIPGVGFSISAVTQTAALYGKYNVQWIGFP